ncbi:hypothetical protein ACFFJX_06860 [Pseudarcicella hirudinis]|uniref:hypothetical protein n=1 Tax=Pseudarcicella hirudinis TaxID=1079859 RepID=UPI0035EAEC98
MLHIATPLFRYEYLEQIYESIPKNEDIIWHISKIKERPALTFDFLADPRVRVYECDCLDTDTVTKRNVIFDQIKDGYFCLLDDDTVFEQEMYNVYKSFSEKQFKGMVIGAQKFSSGKIRLKPTYPHNGTFKLTIDTGMILSNFTVLNKVRWEFSETIPNDAHFWYRCYQFYGKELTILIPDTISLYNKFAPFTRIKKQIFGRQIRFEIQI